jgi:hypothetical protein
MSKAAADAYRQLSTDATCRDLLARVDAILDQLDVDPFHPSVRRRSFDAPIWGRRLFVAVARGHDEDWLVLWAPNDAGRPKVWYLGSDTGTGGRSAVSHR